MNCFHERRQLDRNFPTEIDTICLQNCGGNVCKNIGAKIINFQGDENKWKEITFDDLFLGPGNEKDPVKFEKL